MDYYLLTMGNKSKNVIKPYMVDKTPFLQNYKNGDFESLAQLEIGHFEWNEKAEIIDIFLEPAYIISDMIKSVIENYDSTIKFKGIQLFSEGSEEIISKLFWIPKFSEVPALHSNTEILPNRCLKKLVLDKNKIYQKHIFKVGGLLETRIVISERVAEAILRRKPLGVKLEKVEVA